MQKMPESHFGPGWGKMESVGTECLSLVGILALRGYSQNAFRVQGLVADKTGCRCLSLKMYAWFVGLNWRNAVASSSGNRSFAVCEKVAINCEDDPKG